MKDSKVYEFVYTLFYDFSYDSSQEYEYKRNLINSALDTVFDIFVTFKYNTNLLIAFIDRITDINNIKDLDELKRLLIKNFTAL